MTVSIRLDPGALDRLLSAVDGPTGQVMTRLGNQMLTVARGLANVDTGLMRSRTDFTLTSEGGELVGILAARTDYAYFVHEGTRYMDGNPFLLGAAEQVLHG